MHKKRLEMIGNGQFPGQQSTSTTSPHSFILGSGNLMSPGNVRLASHRMGKNWSPHDSPRDKLNSSVEVSILNKSI